MYKDVESMLWSGKRRLTSPEGVRKPDKVLNEKGARMPCNPDKMGIRTVSRQEPRSES